MPTWLEVQRSKSVFFHALYDIINDIKYFRNCLHHTSAVPQPFLLLNGANLALAGFLGLKMELMVCTDLVGGTTEQIFLFRDLI